MTSNTPSGVVLDEPEARALLYAVIQEGLADTDPMIADGFVGGILRNAPAPGILNRALEQLVIGGAAWVPFPIPTEWHGEVFESGQIRGTPWDKSKEEVLEKIDPLVILQMLAARGRSMSPEEFDAIRDRLDVAVDCWGSLTDESLLQFHVRQMLTMTDRKRRGMPSGELTRAADELTAASAAAEPIKSCIETYIRVIATSFEHDALSSLPISGEPGPLLAVSDPPRDVNERMAIASFVCRELRTMPYAPTLSGTLSLARTAEAAALRDRLTEWADCVRCGNDHIETVRQEIEYAQRELRSAEMWSGVGLIYTAIALPTSLLAVVNPMLGELFGATLTIGGVISAAASANLKRRNRWAMFGSAVIDDRSN
jgi:hypothetical protein